MENGDAVHISETLTRNLISKYGIFQGVCGSSKLTTVAKIFLIIFFPLFFLL